MTLFAFSFKTDFGSDLFGLLIAEVFNFLPN